MSIVRPTTILDVNSVLLLSIYGATYADPYLLFVLVMTAVLVDVCNAIVDILSIKMMAVAVEVLIHVSAMTNKIDAFTAYLDITYTMVAVDPIPTSVSALI